MVGQERGSGEQMDRERQQGQGHVQRVEGPGHSRNGHVLGSPVAKYPVGHECVKHGHGTYWSIGLCLCLWINTLVVSCIGEHILDGRVLFPKEFIQGKGDLVPYKWKLLTCSCRGR